MSRYGRVAPSDQIETGIRLDPQNVPGDPRPHQGSPSAKEDLPESYEASQGPRPERFPGPRWSLAFVGLLSYLIFEYLRVPAQFPFLRPFALGKVTLGLCALGLLFEARTTTPSVTSARVTQFMVGFVVLIAFISACIADYQEEAWEKFFILITWTLTAIFMGRVATSSWRQRICVLVVLVLNLKMAQAVIRNYSAYQAGGSSGEDLATRGVGAGSVGFFANSGDFGAAMCVVWGITAMLLLSEPRKSIKVLLLVCLAAFSIAVVASGSRGAFLAVCAQGLAIFLRKPNPKRIGALMVAFLLLPAFYFLLPEANKSRLRSLRDPEQDRTARVRLDLWRAGAKMFRDHPVIGVGPGNFNPHYDVRYAGPDRHPTVTAPHSIYVQNLAELGILGFVPLVAIWIGYFLMNRQTRIRLGQRGHQEGKSFEIALTRGLDLAMIGYLVSGAFATLFYFPHMWILLGFAIGLHVAAGRLTADWRSAGSALPETTLQSAAG